MIITLNDKEWIELGKVFRVGTDAPEVLQAWNIYGARYHAALFALVVGGEIVSANATRFSLGKSKNAWGKYINWYVAYTKPEHRHKGYASRIQEYVERLAIESGYSRLKSLAQSYAGFRIHLKFGHHFYGVNDRNHLIVDSPLSPATVFPEGVPMEARSALNAHKLSKAELREILLAKPYNAEYNFEGKPENIYR